MKDFRAPWLDENDVPKATPRQIAALGPRIAAHVAQDKPGVSETTPADGGSRSSDAGRHHTLRTMPVDEFGLSREDHEEQRRRRMVLDMRKAHARSPWWRKLFGRGTRP